MRTFRLLALCAVFAFCAASAFADDINPPPWQRGAPGTTYAQWEFLTPDPIAMPDLVNNPFGVSPAQVTPGLLQNWWPIWGGKEGVWPLSGTIRVPIQNSPIPNPYKDIWIQITWAQQAVNVFPVVTELTKSLTADLVGDSIIGGHNEGVGDGLWHHSTYHIRMFPNPIFEEILIEGAIMVDELVIDTQCVPEPSSILVLAGLVGFVIRRRK